MPIRTTVPVEVFDQERFHQVDHRVTGLAFDIHNEFGRYLQEPLYQRELARRCRAAGLEAELEFHISVALDGFRKDYYADLLVNRGVIVETKAAAALAPAHKGQTLKYLFLCGLHHGTLLNFQTERVQHEFVSTRLTRAERLRYELVTGDWKPLTPACESLHPLLLRLLAEWGVYLDPVLYRDAITYFLGGKERVLREIHVKSAGSIIGSQEMYLVNDGIAFVVTASTHRPESVCEHQRRFLKHTDLRAIHWINFNHSQVELRTIERS